MEFPEDLRYTKDHEWIRLHEDGKTATIGITDFAQGELGEIVYVEVETIGETVNENQVFGTIEAVKTTSELFMPVTGKVLEVNSKITSPGEDQPEFVNTHPYGDGWIIKVELSNPSQIDTLMTHTAYKEHIGA